MIIVCMSRSGVLFNDTWHNRAEYGDMYTALEKENGVYRVDIGNGNHNFVLGKTYWRPAKGLEIDLFYNGARHLNKITKF